MRTRQAVSSGVVVGLLSFVLTAQEVVVTHEPWLNWDFLNLTPGPANDFEIVVESPMFQPGETAASPFLSPPTVTNNVDADLDGDLDTILTWAGAVVNPGSPAHIGAYMAGSGEILDAYWTLNGVKVGLSLPITYELTRVVYPDPTADPWLGMRLSWPDSFFDVLADWQGLYPDGPWPAAQFGWTGIRTFAEIPAGALGLGDLNGFLSLDGLSAFETDPLAGGPMGAPITPAQFYPAPPDSFFDIFITSEFTPSPDFESLLFAEVAVDLDGAAGPLQPQMIGRFWNLNSQSPEPSTAALLALGGLGCLLRRRRRAAA